MITFRHIEMSSKAEGSLVRKYNLDIFRNIKMFHGRAQLFTIPCTLFPLSYYTHAEKTSVLLVHAQKVTAASLKPSFGLKTQTLKSLPFICIWNLERLTPLCLLAPLVFKYTSVS